MARVDFQPLGKRIDVPLRETLLEAAQKAGIDLVVACGGVGICGTCLVRFIQGELSPLNSNEKSHLTPEQVLQGYRLACQALVEGDVRVEILPETLITGQYLQVEGQEKTMALDPAVVPVDVSLDEPSLEDQRSDWTRLEQALAGQGFPVPLQADLAQRDVACEYLRSQGWRARLAVHSPAAGFYSNGASMLAAVLPSGLPLLGLAVDMGSTKLAGYLVDLQSGATLAQGGAMNPQISYGEDVVSRIAYANRGPEQRKILQTRLVETINQMVDQFCQQAGVSGSQIVDAVLVGNTAMHHLFCGLPVRQLGMSPYVAAVSEALDVRCAEVGLRLAPGAWMHLPANIAGYVGDDHTAALLSSWGDEPENTQVLVDIGTNTEISLWHRGNISTCSTASGPAFEGAHIRDGMRASRGAIDKVRITSSGVQVFTIEGAPPTGICGTGILQAIAEMVNANILDRRGTLRKSAPGVRKTEGGAEFVLVEASASGHGREIAVTRRDVHEIQLAKGAIRAGIEILLEAEHLSAADVDGWVIAGAFGTYLDIASALQMGMFPPAPVERFHQVGNAAGMGAKQMLLSRGRRLLADSLARRSRYIELTTCADFTQKYVDSMYFGEHE